MLQISLNSLKATEEFAKFFIAELLVSIKLHGIVIGLEGSLGAGKTTFVSALLKNLSPDAKVSSPTYVLQHEYISPDGIVVHHWDLYRVPFAATPEELLEFVLPGELRLIEWASRSDEVMRDLDIILKFELLSELSRSCQIKILPSGKDKGIVIPA